jgi:hypothetical protein
MGGGFNNIAGKNQTGLAAVNINTGKLSSWDPKINGSPLTILLKDSIMYVGGYFNKVDTATRLALAAISLKTGLATSWNPRANGYSFNHTKALVLKGSTLYVGGYFRSLGGQTRLSIGAVDINTGLATSWNPNPTYWNGDLVINGLSVDGNLMYAGGSFGGIGGKQQKYAAALDLSTGTATNWNPDAKNTVWTIHAEGSSVFLGGSGVLSSGQRYFNAGAVDAATGQTLNWGPNFNGHVFTIGNVGTKLFVGGEYYQVDSLLRGGIIMFEDITTGLNRKSIPRAELSVYPNPVSDFVTVQRETNTPCAFLIRNTLGQIMQSGTISETAQQIDCSRLTKGAYFLQLEGYETRKLVKW